MRKKTLFYCALSCASLGIVFTTQFTNIFPDTDNNFATSQQNQEALLSQEEKNTQQKVLALPNKETAESANLQALNKENLQTQNKDSQSKDDVQHFTNFDFFSSSSDSSLQLAEAPVVSENQAEISADEEITQEVSYSGYVLSDDETIIKAKLEKGETISTILNTWLTTPQIFEVIELSKELHNLEKNLQIGYPYAIILDKNGYIKRFEYEKNRSDIFVLDVTENITTEEDGSLNSKPIFSAKLEAIPYKIELAHVEAEIESSLSAAATNAGESDALVAMLDSILAYQIDFNTEVQKGDTFSVLVEKKYRDNQHKGYGSILTTTFINNGKEYSAYKFEDADGRVHYYDENGVAFERLLLKAPLDYKRISSGYTMARKHPILGITRPHQGIDYAAPMGTPVRTVGDGTVTFAGTQGGYGKLIIVKHSNGLETMYAHLSKIRVKKGQKVTRGDTIGNVGSTGLSTGPHLDYRIKKNGKFINPSSLDIPNAPSLEGEEKEAFLVFVAETKALINGTQEISSNLIENNSTNEAF